MLFVVQHVIQSSAFQHDRASRVSTLGTRTSSDINCMAISNDVYLVNNLLAVSQIIGYSLWKITPHEVLNIQWHRLCSDDKRTVRWTQNTQHLDVKIISSALCHYTYTGPHNAVGKYQFNRKCSHHITEFQCIIIKQQ